MPNGTELNNKTVLLFITNALTVNPKHPITKFSAGNLQSLSDKEGSKLNDTMREYFEQNYSSNIMKLSIVGSQSLAELKAFAQKHFSSFKNKGIKSPVATATFFTPESLQKEIFVKTKVATDTLMLQFPIENNFSTWQHKPNKYIQYLLWSQEDGTLGDSLIKANLVERV